MLWGVVWCERTAEWVGQVHSVVHCMAGRDICLRELLFAASCISPPPPPPPPPLQVCRRHSGVQQETCLSVPLTEDVRALLASDDCFVHLRFCPKPASKAELIEDEYPKQLYVRINSSAITIPVGGTLSWLFPMHSVSNNNLLLTQSPPHFLYPPSPPKNTTH